MQTQIKLERQAKAVLRVPAGGYPDLAAYLGGNDSAIENAAFRDAVLAEEKLLIIFGEEFRGAHLDALVEWGLQPRQRPLCLPRRLRQFARRCRHGSCFPICFPVTFPVAAPAAFAQEYPGLPATARQDPNRDACSCSRAASWAHCSSSVQIRLRSGDIDSAALEKHLRHRSGSFSHRDRGNRRRRLSCRKPLREDGTVTNTYGDLQLARKGADRAGVKSDFEILVRLAGSMGADVKSLVPFGKGGVTPTSVNRAGAQSGEADRHAVWLSANNLEPKLSPFDPLAVLDEIERLVPGYKLDRLNLFGGNDVRDGAGICSDLQP